MCMREPDEKHKVKPRRVYPRLNGTVSRAIISGKTLTEFIHANLTENLRFKA